MFMFYEKYKSFPVPALRRTLYLKCMDNRWKVIHAHFLFQPEK